jgi:toxin-antitoxin system PIN domain toxin
MTTYLLDGNVLVALVVHDHVHHEEAARWFGEARRTFATCPITQGTLLRLLMQQGVSGGDAAGVLRRLTDHPAHEFWPDGLGYGEVDLASLLGHRQVTDAYLAQLARSHAGRLATLDKGLVEAHADVAEPLGRAGAP